MTFSHIFEIIFSLSSSVSTNLIMSRGCISRTQHRRLRTSKDIFVSPFLNFRMVSCPKIPLFFAVVVFIPTFANSGITSILYCSNLLSPPFKILSLLYNDVLIVSIKVFSKKCDFDVDIHILM